MIFFFYGIVALAGAAIHLWRHPADREPSRAVGVVLLWWLVVALGL